MDVALKPASSGHRIDPVTTEIVRNGLIAATEEMKTNLMRTAYNMIIYEALDFTTGLFTADGDTVSIGICRPSEKISVVAPSRVPPTSGQCAMQQENATTSPSWKIGTVKVMWLRWLPVM